MSTEIAFNIVAYGSDTYHEAVALSEEVLRLPLGLTFSEEELAHEQEQIHIVGFIDGALCVSAALAPDGQALKMRRVVVQEKWRRRGLGAALLRFCEEYALAHGFSEIYCHARGTAIDFYTQNGYQTEGESFEEDSLPHQRMRKRLA